MRLAPPEDSQPQDQPGFDRLHHVCQLWVDYLTTEAETEKQQLLHDAARHMMLVGPRGDEGEEVFDQVWKAIRRRDRVYAPYFTGARLVPSYVQACGDDYRGGVSLVIDESNP